MKRPPRMNEWCGVPSWFGENNQRPKPKPGEQKKQNVYSFPPQHY